MAQERENPLPDGAWVEVTTQFDDADDERGRFLVARRRPYDAVETEIALVRPAFPSSPSEPFIRYLDRADPQAPPLPPLPFMEPRQQPTEPALTLVAAWRRLAAEEPTLFACVSLCYLRRRSERATARELGITNSRSHARKRAGVAQLVVWSHQAEDEVEAWLRALGTLRAARAASAATEAWEGTQRGQPSRERA